jgi:hypothetical protein
MKAKDKAIDLYNNYILIQESIDWGCEKLREEAGIIYHKNNDEYDEYYKQLAKQSALITVNEILNDIPDNDIHNSRIDFWKDVKIEIEKL